MDDPEMKSKEPVLAPDLDTIKVIDLRQNTLVIDWLIHVLKELDLTIEAAKG